MTLNHTDSQKGRIFLQIKLPIWDGGGGGGEGGGSWSVSIAYQATPPGSRCYAGRFLGAPTGFPPSLPGATSSRRSSVEDQTRKGLLNIL